MALTVNTNIAALNTQRHLGSVTRNLGKSIERLSSGLRINKAADDPAGIAIAAKMSAQVRGSNQAIRNANNAISLVQTAEGGINTITNILQRLRELAVQASSDDNTSTDRLNLKSEADALIAELTRAANTSEFNNMRLLDGSFSGKYFQIGSNYGQNITFSISDTRGSAIGSIAKEDLDIADGVTTAYNANFATGEFTINDTNVAATSSSDDQYSVLDLSSSLFGSIMASDMISAAGLTGSADADSAQSMRFTMRFNINGVSVSLMYSITSAAASNSALTTTASYFLTGGSLAADLVSAIANNASLTALNITARQVNTSGWVIERTGGGNLQILTSIYVSASGATDVSTGIITDSQWFSFFGMIDLVSGTSIIGNGADIATSASAPITYNGESSAISKAAAINQVKNTSGVDASAQPNTVTTTNAVAGGTLAAGDIYINGYDLGSVTVVGNDTDAALVTAINSISSDTGVTASVNSSTGKLTLTAADGRNITITAKSSTEAGYIGLSTAHSGTTYIYRAEIRMVDNSAISLSGTLEDLYGASAGATTKNTDVSKTISVDTSENIATMDYSTQAGAMDAILYVDSALDRVNTIRAEIGAVQNRLEYTVANLTIASENMSASESQIRDADFAFEVATFTRNQIMVQAGTAMLAQANTVPQVALQLLG
jgi:flagellin